jgi:glycosyltransferase involved in cell wall biosynthesis
MSVVVDLVESRAWLETSKWPLWLTAAWLSEQDARLVCRLTHPDDLTGLRAMIPSPDRLLAYPSYSALQDHLDDDDAEKIYSVFLQCLQADHYLTVTPDSNHQADPTPLEPDYRGRTLHTGKAQLAFVSPLPPTASGIAGYCTEILPHLVQYYDITLVVAEPDSIDVGLSAEFEVISHKQMMRQGGQFDRVMYHFGNSSFHYEYFLLMQAHPGIIVLHDTYLGDCIYSNHAQFGMRELSQKIYASHGWAAMPDCDGPVQQAIGLYPACGTVFSASYGVVVHNRHAREILSQNFSREILSALTEVPLARKLKDLDDKSSARQRLGIAEDTTLFCTFGMINLNKCLIELMEGWGSSGLASNPSVTLCFVGGGNHNWEMENRIKEWISKLPYPQQVTVTGYVEAAEYDLYLSAADVAVQLRRNSRGESSAALLDCMGAGLPTIINAHGSMAEIPDGTAFKISDDFTIAELAETLAAAARDSDSRLAVGSKARDYVKAHHNPEHVAAAYFDHMEARYHESPDVLIDQLQTDVLGSKVHMLPADMIYACSEAIDDLMRCAGVRRTSLAGSQLFIDVSALVQHDAKQGIQRVVRNILRQLLQDHYLGYRVEPVYYDVEAECFRYARTFTDHFMGLPPLYLSDDPIEALPGDIYLGLDLCYCVAEQEASRQWLQFWRGRGVRICNVVYDLLPITLPDSYTEGTRTLYTRWLKAITRISDCVVCTSNTTADEYCNWLDNEKIDAISRPNIARFQLGADMEAQNRIATLTAAEQTTMDRIQHQPYLLMVGSVEPRKEHQQVLAAFEALQLQGCKLSLVIAGCLGGIDDQFADHLKRLGAGSSSVYWLDFVSDPMLKELYQNAAGTVMASHGEGFGLPLVEAAYHGSPLLVRNLPVFREVCGDSAWYFESTDGKGLATDIQTWLTSYNEATLPDASWIPSIDWKQSTEQLMDSVIRQMPT